MYLRRLSGSARKLREVKIEGLFIVNFKFIVVTLLDPPSREEEKFIPPIPQQS